MNDDHLLELLLLIKNQELLSSHEEGVSHAVKLKGGEETDPLDDLGSPVVSIRPLNEAAVLDHNHLVEFTVFVLDVEFSKEYGIHILLVSFAIEHRSCHRSCETSVVLLVTFCLADTTSLGNAITNIREVIKVDIIDHTSLKLHVFRSLLLLLLLSSIPLEEEFIDLLLLHLNLLHRILCLDIGINVPEVLNVDAKSNQEGKKTKNQLLLILVESAQENLEADGEELN